MALNVQQNTYPEPTTIAVSAFSPSPVVHFQFSVQQFLEKATAVNIEETSQNSHPHTDEDAQIRTRYYMLTRQAKTIIFVRYSHVTSTTE